MVFFIQIKHRNSKPPESCHKETREKKMSLKCMYPSIFWKVSTGFLHRTPNGVCKAYLPRTAIVFFYFVRSKHAITT